MADACFRIARVGPHVSIQDGGRPGLMRYGVPASGPMDRFSAAAANVALGNPSGAPLVEASMGGLALECLEGAVTVAVAGGGFLVDNAGEKPGCWAAFTVRAGETLSIRPGHWGCWTYLAFAGRLEAAAWLGSVSTHSQSGFGGGRLAAGAGLTVRDPEIRPDREGPIPFPVGARARSTIDVVVGPQERFFPAGAVETLLSAPFRLTDAYDRMGVRLAGPALPPDGALAIPSEPIVRGSIQVSGDGAATVLLADHQTTGGYPKIATLLSDEVDGFAQLRPRDPVAFKAVTPETAVALVRGRALARERYLEMLALRSRA